MGSKIYRRANMPRFPTMAMPLCFPEQPLSGGPADLRASGSQILGQARMSCNDLRSALFFPLCARVRYGSDGCGCLRFALRNLFHDFVGVFLEQALFAVGELARFHVHQAKPIRWAGHCGRGAERRRRSGCRFLSLADLGEIDGDFRAVRSADPESIEIEPHATHCFGLVDEAHRFSRQRDLCRKFQTNAPHDPGPAPHALSHAALHSSLHLEGRIYLQEEPIGRLALRRLLDQL